ncbi:MAG TPA: division plane positioning ATPase MipZ [Kiloniellaceae bacterium]|nr:division plane positioning ATPase MipZ [Kiloniellaceae bacterium]
MTTAFFRKWFAKPIRPRIITFANQKGGSGKTTSAMNVTVGLMSCGFKVGTLDLDSDQGTFTHFVENRRRQASLSRFPLDMPEHRLIDGSLRATISEAEEEETDNLEEALLDLQDCDYVVIDTPGNDTFLSRLGHILADTLITPMNDSFLDLDVLVRLDAGGRRITGPSGYAVQVLDRWGLRVLVAGEPFDWIVIRNRLAHLGNRNSFQMGDLLEQLAPRLGFRVARGFGERVVFRELFPAGLTLLDPEACHDKHASSRSRAAARDEVWALLNTIGLSELPQARATWNKKLGVSLSGIHLGATAGTGPDAEPQPTGQSSDP